MGKEADVQRGKEVVIEEVTDMDAAWPKIEPLVLGIVDYHKAWDERVLRPDWATRMREYMASKCVTYLARSDAGEPVGFLSGTIDGDFGIFQGVVGHIDNAFVVEDARRQGVGQRLYECFETACRNQGVGEVRLDVAVGNDMGDRFWRKAGFRTQTHAMSKPLEAPR